VVGVLGGLGLFVLLVWVSVRLIFVPPVLMLERQRLFPSLARAWRLTRGSFWRVLGINLLAQLIAQVVSQVLTVPTSVIGMLIAGGDESGLASGGYIATMTIGMAIAYTIPAIFLAGVVALQYIDVRIRKEGLDVQLARAAEASAGRVG
jgi:membrane-anchored glycerophosphoryl diester phosphodiesterase (GDPDase)